QVLAHLCALAPNLGHQHVIIEIRERLGASDEGKSLAAEGTGVLARRPVLVVLGLDQVHRQWRAEAADALGQAYDVRVKIHAVEAEVAAGTATSRLDVVEDQQRTEIAREL